MATNAAFCDVVELHYKDVASNSDKFYRTFAFRQTCYIQYGRRGTEGQWSTKPFPTERLAQEFAAKQVRAKEQKGYRQTRTARFPAPPTANVAELQRLFKQTATGSAPTGPTPSETAKAVKAQEDAEAEKFRQQLLAMRKGLDAKAEDTEDSTPDDSLESKLAAALAAAKAKA